MKANKVSIVIPVFNEAATVKDLLFSVWAQPISIDKELIIIESNSTDGTRALVKEFAQEKNRVTPGVVTLVLQDRPKGKGFAVRQGLEKATGDIILIQDGDLEYDVKDYPQLLQPIIDGKASFVLGSRHLSASTWKIRSFAKDKFKAVFMNLGGALFHSFFNVVYRQKLTDPTTMYKVFEKKCLKGIHFESNRFDFDFELVAKLIRAGYTPLEVPVSYKSRGFDEGKKIRVFRDPFAWIWAIVKFRFVPL